GVADEHSGAAGLRLMRIEPQLELRQINTAAMKLEHQRCHEDNLAVQPRVSRSWDGCRFGFARPAMVAIIQFRDTRRSQESNPDHPVMSSQENRVAVVAIHGVADQKPHDTAQRICDLLLGLKQDNITYPGFNRTRLRVPVRAVAFDRALSR